MGNAAGNFVDQARRLPVRMRHNAQPLREERADAEQVPAGQTISEMLRDMFEETVGGIFARNV